jgi:hypothetical protein
LNRHGRGTIFTLAAIGSRALFGRNFYSARKYRRGCHE